MNDKEEKELIKTTKKTILTWVVTFFLGSCVGLTVFYFNTTYVQAQNTSDIKEMKLQLRKVTTVPVLNQSEITNIKKDVARIEHKQEENHKENKAAISDLRRQNLKILELLYQIKRQN